MGPPPPDYHEEWATHTVHVHDFASLSTVRGEFVDSPEFMLLGNQWRLGICPGGDEGAVEGMVTVDLSNRSDKAIDIDFGFSINDRNGKQVAYEQFDGPHHFASVGDADGNNLGGPLIL
jgi:hypothetical protein